MCIRDSYNITQLAGVDLTMGLFEEMRKNPRVIGVKNSSMPVSYTHLDVYKRQLIASCKFRMFL